MTPHDKETILRLLTQHRIMTVATVRPDGWPQATTVGYASEGLVLYFLCGRQSQKAVNIAADNRISLVIDHDTSDPMGIEGLSMAARAYAVTDPAEMAKVLELIGGKFPEYGLAPADLSRCGCSWSFLRSFPSSTIAEASAIATSSRSPTPIAGPSSARASSRRRCCA